MAATINTLNSVFMTQMSLLVNACAAIMYIALSAIFTGMGMNNGLGFPLIDEIVFNQLPFLDPNFINPSTANNSVANILQGTVSSMYYTFFVIAGAVFTVAALIIGIKLAITSIALQKAQYKQAIMNWLIGLLMLFTVHFIMAGIFMLNEQICQFAYDACNSNSLEFQIKIAEVVPVVGKTIQKIADAILSGINNIFNTNFQPATYTMHGFDGFMWTVILRAIGGDMVMSILLVIMLGQTCALIFSYIKRLFYCILLGMLAPLVIAVDVIKKSV